MKFSRLPRLCVILPALAVSVAPVPAAAPAPSPPEAAVQHLSSANARLELTPSASTITTKDRLDISFVLTCDPGWEVGEVSVQDALPDGWQVASSPQFQESHAAGKNIFTATLSLDPFLPGTAHVKPMKLTVRPAPADPTAASTQSATPAKAPAPAEQVIQTQPFDVVVNSVLTPEEEGKGLAEIKPVVSAPEPSRLWVWAAGGATSAAAVALALVAIAKARRRAAMRIVRRPAHELALERLKALEARGVRAGADGVSEFIVQASLVLRQYMEDRYGLKAPERTTEEFLEEARRSKRLDADQVVVLEQYLALSDQVKFAKMPAGEAEARASLGAARDFIERTRLVEATVPVSGPGVREPIALELARQRQGGGDVPV